MAPTADYDGRFAFMRLRYGRPSGGFSIREPWAHDYPRADFHFLKILSELNMGSSVYSTPVPANGMLFISNRNMLFALAEGASSTPSAQ